MQGERQCAIEFEQLSLLAVVGRGRVVSTKGLDVVVTPKGGGDPIHLASNQLGVFDAGNEKDSLPQLPSAAVTRTAAITLIRSLADVLELKSEGLGGDKEAEMWTALKGVRFFPTTEDGKKLVRLSSAAELCTPSNQVGLYCTERRLGTHLPYFNSLSAFRPALMFQRPPRVAEGRCVMHRCGGQPAKGREKQKRRCEFLRRNSFQAWCRQGCGR